MKTALANALHNVFKQSMPSISKTEREALEAGGTGFEAELFSGFVNWDDFLSRPEPTLTAKEQAFIDGPLAELMSMLNEYEFSNKKNLSEQVWKKILTDGFLGLVIPEQYGGKGFSNYAHARIVETLATRSPSTAVTVMVPNSLGPAELLLHYGTPEQKEYYLPRLAKGLEIPCFGLTGPWAGSDAASLPDTGVVCKKVIDGKEVLGLNVTCSKRYITLAPVATVIGLALRVLDPDNLLGKGKEPGITLALLGRDHPGLKIGDRHDPMGAAFMNGTIQAQNMFVDLSKVIGGPEKVGTGWKMLMECLAAGRAISLPSMATASAKMTARAAGGYSALREQFGMPVGKFHGVGHALSEIAWRTYSMEASRRFAMASLDAGEKPAVASGILKYHLTESGRTTVSHGMDVVGGKGICQGPSNFLGYAWQYGPIGITVEGANILTRCLIIFGQGAIRCHPYLLKEVHQAEQGDKMGLLSTVTAHLKHAFSLWWNNCPWKAQKQVEKAGFVTEMGRQYAARITHASRSFALAAEISLGVLGASLKKMELLSGRLGDALSHLYMASACVKRLEKAQESPELLDAAELALQSHLYEAKKALIELAMNMPNKWGRRLICWVARPQNIVASAPSDKLRLRATEVLMKAGPARDSLTDGVWAPMDEHDAVGAIEVALASLPKVAAAKQAIKQNMKAGLSFAQAVDSLSPGEREQYQAYFRVLERVVNVDSFEPTHTLPTKLLN